MKFQTAQMEIMGLALIVVLVAVGLLFLIALNIGKKPAKELSRYEQTKMANSFVLAFLKTSACNVSIENVVYDCFTTKTLNCPRFMDSCEFLKNTTDIILNRTIKQWGYMYNLSFIGNSKTISVVYKGCNKTREAPGIQPLPLYPYPGNVIVRLELCER